MEVIEQTVKRLSIRDLREQLRARGCNPGGGVEELRLRLAESMMSGGAESFQPQSQRPPPLMSPSAPAPAVVKRPPGGASQIAFGDNNLPSSVPQNKAVSHSMDGVAAAMQFQHHSTPSYSDPHGYNSNGAGYGGMQQHVQHQQYAQQQHQHLPESSRSTAAPYFSQQPYITDRAEEDIPDKAERPYIPSIVHGAMPLYGARSQAPYGIDATSVAPAAVKSSKPSAKGGVASKPSQVNNYPRPGGNQNLGNKITNRPTSKVSAPPGGKSQISLGWD
ncbi:hypothetical protein CEUSTIGMA_g10244.t1 [Chlamydomonas eustigma]|uniref:SAP domain-containing protein n=1 Tax=Chlamydomonas eustigma TaxID=1157962 RepID=A0A250XIB4_9CHLO|nr:hypothetical protein CEUSTIGMA_g10244.t1 [Chlamydomonas eustigma]|eukprot:GAX82818.1 hypothetical protein CEUSTIGMA_g10244.t1 [Chlamydomonas eustigma]